MAQPRREARPIAGPEAFARVGSDARLSQAAMLLSMSAGVAGETEAFEDSDQFPLPPMDALHRVGRMSVAEAAEPLAVDSAAYLSGDVRAIPRGEAARLAQRVYDDPAPQYAAALVEAGLHSPDRLVRTAAAASALDTTGPREPVLAQLEASLRARDPTTRDIARTALARAMPEHPALAAFIVKPVQPRRRALRSHTAVVTHGTFAANARWWRPGGDFYVYLDGLVPALHLHDQSFRWSGAYSAAARDLAADVLVDWVAAQQLNRPDLFAHSHGVTVANLATHKGLDVERLVMLAWPVHAAWLPDLARCGQVIDERVRYDLVILADRGGQRLPAAFRASPNVREHVVGWFRHGLPHDPAHWQANHLDQDL